MLLQYVDAVMNVEQQLPIWAQVADVELAGPEKDVAEDRRQGEYTLSFCIEILSQILDFYEVKELPMHTQKQENRRILTRRF
jgi:hypothetical protein